MGLLLLPGKLRLAEMAVGANLVIIHIEKSRAVDDALRSKVIYYRCSPVTTHDLLPPSETPCELPEHEGISRTFCGYGMLINKVIVVQNPNVPEDVACVENRSECARYILLTVIPDVPLAYEMNLPVLQTLGTLSLSSWEFSRATTRACRKISQGRSANEPCPRFFNKSKVK